MSISVLPNPIHGTHDSKPGNVVAVTEDTMLFVPDAGGSPAMCSIDGFRADKGSVKSVQQMVKELIGIMKEALEPKSPPLGIFVGQPPCRPKKKIVLKGPAVPKG